MKRYLVLMIGDHDCVTYAQHVFRIQSVIVCSLYYDTYTAYVQIAPSCATSLKIQLVRPEP